MDIKNTNDIVATKITALIVGESGAGKTTLAKTLPPKTIVISLEGGMLSLQGCNVDYIEIDCKRKIESLRKILDDVSKSDYDNVMIDSLTEISQAFVEFAKLEYPDDRQTMKMYGYYNELMIRFIKYCRDMDKNIFFTALQKTIKDDIGRMYHHPEMIGSIAGKCVAYFDFVFALLVFEKDGVKKRALLTNKQDNYACKDRSGRLDAFEPPHLGDIINKVFDQKQEEKQC